MLGVTAGLDPAQAAPGHLQRRAATPTPSRASPQRALSGKFSPPSFALNLAYKDLHLALELGDELGVPLPQGSSTHNLQRMARGMGLGPTTARRSCASTRRCWDARSSREVRLDQRRHQVGVRLRQVVIAARHDMQPRVGNALLEMPAHGDRTDRRPTSPQISSVGAAMRLDRQVDDDALRSVIQSTARGNDLR